MSNVSKTTLKTYFVSGATPTEAQFGDLIDSSINVVDDVTSSLSSESTLTVLSSAGAKNLKDALDAVDLRVVTLENAENDFAQAYYNKTEVDSKFTNMGQTIDGLPYAGQIADLTTRVGSSETSIANKTDVGHHHEIEDVTGLQISLNDKAEYDDLDATRAELIAAINEKVSAGHTHVMADITDLEEFDLSLYAKLTDLDSKAAASHQHLVADITDISTVYYNRTEIDSKIAGINTEHTHIEADITDLDKYTQAQTNLKILDHTGLVNNPHSVTKDQVGLGSVENKTVSEIFSSSESDAYQAEIMSDVNDLLATTGGSLSAHTGNKNNPHEVTKAQVGLGNVPDIDVKALLDAHTSAANPHDIDLSFFDVYSKAESDERVTLGLDSIRYPFVPTAPTDGAGSVGDLTWGADSDGNYKAYLKVAESAWRALNLFQEASNGDVNFDYDTNFEENVTIKKNLTVEGKSSLGDIEIENSTIKSVLGKLVLLSEQAKVEVSDDLDVTGKIDVAGCGQISNVSICSSTISTTDSSLFNLPQNVKVTGQLETTGLAKIGGNLEVMGNLTVQGTQTILNTTTLDVEDNIVKLNKNVTGAPSANAGLEIERGNQTNSKIYWDESVDLWKIDSGGTVKIIAFDEELDTLRTNVNASIGTTNTNLTNHKNDTSNPHSVTKAQVGLGNCDNTSDANKPVSTAQATAIGLKVDQSAYNTKITALENAITSLQTSVSTLTTNLNNLDGDAYSES